MSGSEHARPVFVTPEQRRALGYLEDAIHEDDWAMEHIEAMRRAWDAAPADPPEAVYRTLRKGTYHTQKACDEIATSLLRALGHPKEPA